MTAGLASRWPAADPGAGRPAGRAATWPGRYARAAQDVGAQAGALRRDRARAGWERRGRRCVRAHGSAAARRPGPGGPRFQRVAQALQGLRPGAGVGAAPGPVALALARAAQAAQQARAALAAAAGPRRPAGPADGRITDRQRARGTRQRPTTVAHAHRLLAAACRGAGPGRRPVRPGAGRRGHDRLRNPQRLAPAPERRSRGWPVGLSTWLGVAAVVLCWVPGLGEALGAAALGLGTVELLADLALTAYGETVWPAPRCSTPSACCRSGERPGWAP